MTVTTATTTTSTSCTRTAPSPTTTTPCQTRSHLPPAPTAPDNDRDPHAPTTCSHAPCAEHPAPTTTHPHYTQPLAPCTHDVSHPQSTWSRDPVEPRTHTRRPVPPRDRAYHHGSSHPPSTPHMRARPHSTTPSAVIPPAWRKSTESRD